MIGGILYLTVTQADGTRVTENIGTASEISSINFSNGTSVGYGALASQITGQRAQTTWREMPGLTRSTASAVTTR